MGLFQPCVGWVKAVCQNGRSGTCFFFGLQLGMRSRCMKGIKLAASLTDSASHKLLAGVLSGLVAQVHEGNHLYKCTRASCPILHAGVQTGVNCGHAHNSESLRCLGCQTISFSTDGRLRGGGGCCGVCSCTWLWPGSGCCLRGPFQWSHPPRFNNKGFDDLGLADPELTVCQASHAPRLSIKYRLRSERLSGLKVGWGEALRLQGCMPRYLGVLAASRFCRIRIDV